jgi:hypothetical protein
MLAGSSGSSALNANPGVVNFMGIGQTVTNTGIGHESAVQVFMPISGTFSHFNVAISAALAPATRGSSPSPTTARRRR